MAFSDSISFKTTLILTLSYFLDESELNFYKYLENFAAKMNIGRLITKFENEEDLKNYKT